MKKLLCVLMFGMMFGQTELTTRTYELPFDCALGEATYIYLDELTGIPLTTASVSIFDVEDISVNNYARLNLKSSYSANSPDGLETYWKEHLVYVYDTGSWGGSSAPIYYYNANQFKLDCDFANAIGTLILSITSEFPQEDTGYIEDGFDYCLHTGANLVSSPCRDEVAIESAIPSDILQNITGIITEGGAASNLGGNWVGSLNGLGGGKGYWVISDIDGCFNYTCSEEN